MPRIQDQKTVHVLLGDMASCQSQQPKMLNHMRLSQKHLKIPVLHVLQNFHVPPQQGTTASPRTIAVRHLNVLEELCASVSPAELQPFLQPLNPQLRCLVAR